MQVNRGGYIFTPTLLGGKVEYLTCVQNGKQYDIYRSGKLKRGCYNWRSFQGVFYNYIELKEVKEWQG